MMEWKLCWRLAAMMALVYSVQGSFWPLLAVHLQDLGLNGRALEDGSSRPWRWARYSCPWVLDSLSTG